ncbi:MAG: hypothetical protein ACUVXJ_08600 [Phycisphaerae bacterium]
MTVWFELNGVFCPAREGASPAGEPPAFGDLGVDEALAPGGSAENGLTVGLPVVTEGLDCPSEELEGDGGAGFGLGLETEGAASGVMLGRKDEPPPLVGGPTKVDRFELLDRPKPLLEKEPDRGEL